MGTPIAADTALIQTVIPAAVKRRIEREAAAEMISISAWLRRFLVQNLGGGVPRRPRRKARR